MGILSNYEHITNKPFPNNVDKFAIDCSATIDNRVPKEIYDVRNNFVGYEIHSMDNVEIPFTVNKSIRVPLTALVYRDRGLSPNNTTVGNRLQKAYNTIDCTSYTCYGYNINGYIWETDAFLEFDLCGDKQIELTPYMSESLIEVKIINFRGKTLLTKSDFGVDTLKWRLTEEEYNKLGTGIFNCEINCITEENSSTVDRIKLIIL